MKNVILLWLFICSIFNVSAQKKADHFTVKFSDGLEYNMNPAGAIIQEDSAISIVGTVKGHVSHSFQIVLIPTDVPKKKFTKGIYHFNVVDQMMDYVPNQSIGYKTKAFYLQQNNGTISQEWITETNPENGFIEIEFISDSRIKGKFSCELLQRLPTSGAKKTVEGTFDVAFMESNNQVKTAPGTQQSSTPIVQQENKASKDASKFRPLLGLYDLQFGLGAITNGEMGLDIDFGATLINLAYDDDASATVELHYDNAREKFDHTIDYLHFRRNNLYARIRPLTPSPNSESDFSHFLGVIVGGLYADVGYSTAKYFYKDYLDNKGPDYSANGLFWGWGWNLVWRSENRWGATFGFGSKRYRVEMPNGTENKYKIRTISLGATYSLIWRR